MDGSGIPEALARTPGALDGHDRLFRIVYYGEALRAICEHVSETLISGPQEPLLELLGDAYDHLSQVRSSFGPEEFSLYVMSLMVGLCDDPDEARQFRLGAAEYILRSAVNLPAEYVGIVREAEDVLRSFKGPDTNAIRSGARRLLSHDPETRDTERRGNSSGRRSEMDQAHPPRHGPAEPQQATPSARRRSSPRPRERVATFERIAIAAFLAGWLGLVLAFAFGDLDFSAEDMSSNGDRSGQM